MTTKKDMECNVEEMLDREKCDGKSGASVAVLKSKKKPPTKYFYLSFAHLCCILTIFGITSFFPRPTYGMWDEDNYAHLDSLAMLLSVYCALICLFHSIWKLLCQLSIKNYDLDQFTWIFYLLEILFRCWSLWYLAEAWSNVTDLAIRMMFYMKFVNVFKAMIVIFLWTLLLISMALCAISAVAVFKYCKENRDVILGQFKRILKTFGTVESIKYFDELEENKFDLSYETWTPLIKGKVFWILRITVLVMSVFLYCLNFSFDELLFYSRIPLASIWACLGVGFCYVIFWNKFIKISTDYARFLGILEIAVNIGFTVAFSTTFGHLCQNVLVPLIQSEQDYFIKILAIVACWIINLTVIATCAILTLDLIIFLYYHGKEEKNNTSDQESPLAAEKELLEQEKSLGKEGYVINGFYDKNLLENIHVVYKY